VRALRWPVTLLAVLLQGLALALSQIWANKTRSALTMIGIIIGVASVTAVIAALTGLKANVLSDFEAFGTNKIYVQPRWPDTGPMRHASWRVIRFLPEQFEGLTDHCPSVRAVTRVGSFRADVRHGEYVIEGTRIVGIDAAWHAIENRAVIQGRQFSLIDEQRAKPVCVITAQTRDKLRLDRMCIGEDVQIAGRAFTIIGMVESHVESSMFNDGMSGDEILIPVGTAWRMREPWLYAIAMSRSPGVSEEAVAELRFFMRQSKGLKPGEPDTFRIDAIEQFLRQFNSVARVITMVAGGIVGISLLVGGVGIMNIMLVSVSERTREIGLRKAVGAKGSAILLQFLTEAVTLCLIGGLVGVIGGELLTLLLSSLPGAKLERAYIPFWAIVLSFGFAASVGVCFGIFPAMKAARLDPIEALRHE